MLSVMFSPDSNRIVSNEGYCGFVQKEKVILVSLLRHFLP